MPRALARALEKREAAPRIIHQDGKSHIEYGQGSTTPLLPVFVEPDLILEGMDKVQDGARVDVQTPGQTNSFAQTNGGTVNGQRGGGRGRRNGL